MREDEGEGAPRRRSRTRASRNHATTKGDKLEARSAGGGDLHAADGDWPAKPTPPFIPGHEGVGIVTGIGPGVAGFKEGDPVGVAWLHDACGECEHCRTGWDSLCRKQRNSGYSVNGSFAEYVIGSAPYVGRLPDNPDFVAMAPIRSSAPASPPTRASRRPRRNRASGSRSPASAGLGNWPSNTPRPWACMSSRSM